MNRNLLIKMKIKKLRVRRKSTSLHLNETIAKRMRIKSLKFFWKLSLEIKIKDKQWRQDPDQYLNTRRHFQGGGGQKKKNANKPKKHVQDAWRHNKHIRVCVCVFRKNQTSMNHHPQVTRTTKDLIFSFKPNKNELISCVRNWPIVTWWRWSSISL